jgi:DNA-binding protein HU-beta
MTSHVKMALLTDVMNQTGLNRTQATRAVDAVFDSIANALQEGKEVRLPAIGTLVPKARPARMRRNPSNGEEFQQEAHFTLSFRVSKVGKELLDKKLRQNFVLPE